MASDAARLGWIEVGLACMALLVFFLPSHSVYQTNALDLTQMTCAMTPDCHPGPSEGLHDTGARAECSFAHDDPQYIELITLWVLMLAAAGTAWRANAWVSGVQIAIALFELGLFSVHGLAHLFERVEMSWVGNTYPLALCAVVLVALWRIVAAWRVRRARMKSEVRP